MTLVFALLLVLPESFVLFELLGDVAPLLGRALLSDVLGAELVSVLGVVVPVLLEVPPLLSEKILPVISTHVAQT